MQELFKDTFKSTKNAHDANVLDVRKRQRQVTTAVHDLLMGMLRAGGTAKEQAISFLLQALELNAENSKDRPSPLKASSLGFMLNLSAVFLQLARPVMENAANVR